MAHEAVEREYPCVSMDGVWRKRSQGGSAENVSVPVAVGVDSGGHPDVIGVAEGMKEDSASWEQFVGGMVERGLRGVLNAAIFSRTVRLYADQ